MQGQSGEAAWPKATRTLNVERRKSGTALRRLQSEKYHIGAARDAKASPPAQHRPGRYKPLQTHNNSSR